MIGIVKFIKMIVLLLSLMNQRQSKIEFRNVGTLKTEHKLKGKPINENDEEGNS